MEEKIKAVIEKCKEYFYAEVEIIREYSNGKSGNGVFLIEMISSINPTKSGKYILKISLSDNKDEFIKEVSNTINISESNTNGILFPKFEYTGSVANTLFYIYNVAGSLLTNTISIQNSNYSYLQRISTEILLGWNSSFLNKKTSINNLINETIGFERLNITSRIASRLQDLIGDSLTPSFEYEGAFYPNPYFYINNNCGPLSIEVNSVIGNVHGDLNINNIIISQSINRSVEEIYFIDYSHYKNDGYLFYDQAYLQLNLLLSLFDETTIYEWYSYVNEDLLRKDDNFSKYHYKFIWYIREGINNFICKNQNANQDDCWIQFWCSQICAGLNWLNKRNLDKNKQALCLLYSSICLQELFRLLGVENPTDSNFKLSVLGDNKEREIWTKLDKFNTNDNRYVLISSTTCLSIDKDTIDPLNRIKWECVFEIASDSQHILKDYLFSDLKKQYGMSYSFVSDNNPCGELEQSTYWCTIQTSETNKKIWYKKYIQNQVNKIVKKVLSLREKYPIYIIVNTEESNAKIIEEIVTEIQVCAEKTFINTIVLNRSIINVEEDIDLKTNFVDFTISDIAKSISFAIPYKPDFKIIYLPQKERKVPLEIDEASYVENDFDIVHNALIWNESDDGVAFYHGAEATWMDIRDHKDIDREDYINNWKKQISNTLEKISLNSVLAFNLFHRAGAGGTTLSKRILWDFHNDYPCLVMKKIGAGTIDRLKLVYNKTKLPILISVEISAGNITKNDVDNIRIELINKGVRALFICVSRIHNLDANRYSNNFYLSNTPNMTMSNEECQKMLQIFKSMTQEPNCIANLENLTWNDEPEWMDLRQPFFYGLFAFDKEYTNIQGFIEKEMTHADRNLSDLIIMLAFLTKYSQIGLNAKEVEKIFNIRIVKHTETDLTETNSLIVHKSTGYQICHPIIAEQILINKMGSDDSYVLNLFEYCKHFIDSFKNIYANDSTRLSDILKELFTYREYYIDEEKNKFSNLVMEFEDDSIKKGIFDYLINCFPDNPHYYNHLARVYIYPSETRSVFDLDTVVNIAQNAITISEQNENESSEIHHHLLGKIYTKKCKIEISASKFSEPTYSLWKRIRNYFDLAQLEFAKCKAGRNNGFGIIGKIELICGILKRISDRKKSSINAIVAREPALKASVLELVNELFNNTIEYEMKYGTENVSYKRAMTDYYQAIGDCDELKRQLFSKNASLKSRIYARHALIALTMQKVTRENRNLYSMNESEINELFDLINQNIHEGGKYNKYDLLMWIKVYMRKKDYNISTAYNFLVEWPNGDNDYFVCFYRYVLAFMLYYKSNGVDYSSVERHLKQCNSLSRNLYGISVINTREMLGRIDDSICLISDNSDSELGQLSHEDRDKYREKNCVFFEGTITEFQNAIIIIKFTLDGNNYFTVKSPIVENISGMNIGDKVRFALGFSYSELRAWNVSLI